MEDGLGENCTTGAKIRTEQRRGDRDTLKVWKVWCIDDGAGGSQPLVETGEIAPRA